MDKPITQKDLDKTLDQKLDEKFAKYQRVILEAINYKFEETNKRISKLENIVNEIRNTLDAFLKRITDFDIEFTIIKAEVAKIKKTFKDKFGIDVSIQGY